MYSCERCGYITEYKSNLKNHLRRKKPCKPIYSSASIETLREKINQKTLRKKINQNHKINDSKMTPIDSKKESPDSKMTPIDSSLKLIDSKMTPIDSKLTPNDSKMTPIDSSQFLIRKHQCKYCKKCYSKNSNLHRHLKKCKSKSNGNETSQLVDFMSNQIKQLKEEHAKREELMRIDLFKVLEKVGNNTQNTYIKEQNIILNNHGNENLDYITTNYLKNLLKIPYSAVPKLIKNIHFNPSHPENRNIKITNKKLPYASIFKNNKWHIKDKKEVIENMVDKGFNILDMQFEKEVEEIKKKKYSKYKVFQQKFEDEDKDLKKQLSKDTVLTILNNK